MMQAERWLPVVGLEKFYEVSDLGHVRTVERMVRSKAGSVRRIRSRVRRHSFLRGYPAVHLSANGRSYMRTIHVMVLEAFVGPRPSPQHEGCHADGTPTNNALTNLRWGTKKDNKADSFTHGTAAHGERIGNAKLTVPDVIAIKADPAASRQLAARYGVHCSTIRRIRNGRAWARALAAEEVQHAAR